MRGHGNPSYIFRAQSLTCDCGCQCRINSAAESQHSFGKSAFLHVIRKSENERPSYILKVIDLTGHAPLPLRISDEKVLGKTLSTGMNLTAAVYEHARPAEDQAVVSSHLICIDYR